MKTLLSAVVTATLAFAAIEASAEATPGERQVALTIEAATLGDALDKWAQQTGFQLFVRDWEGVKNLSAPSLKGTFTAQAALEQLLAGTPLTYVWLNERVVSIRKKAPQTVPTALHRIVLEGQEHAPVMKFDGEEASRASRGFAGSEAIRESSGEPGPRIARVEEVIVTGTHIYGVRNRTAPLMTFDREEIDRRGYVSTQEFIRSLPQNFKGGDSGGSEDGVVGAQRGLSNLEGASGVNIRGLGTSSTLVLLNGHRLAPAALGSIVDVSMIPLSAIERIDVLTDGASAVYGSDAVGGVVNFVLRSDYDGADTDVRASSVTSGGRHQFVVGQTIGRGWREGSGLVSLQYESAGSLASDERSFTADLPRPNDIYPSSSKYSGILTGRQNLTSTLDVSGDVIYTRDDNDRNYAAAGQSQSYSTDTNLMAAHAGIGWQPFGAWRLELSGLYSEFSTETSVNFAPTVAGYTNGSPYLRQSFAVKQGDLVFQGPLFSLPAGPVRAAFGGSYREERFGSRAPWLPASTDNNLDREVRAAFGEIQAPIVSSENSMPFVRSLELSASFRYDDYSDFERTDNPRYGIYWAVSDALALRASYGTSFHAPDVWHQVSNNANQFVFNFPFALPTGGVGPALVTAGSPQLFPEDARSLSIGAEFSPPSMPGFRAVVNHYDIVYRNRLITPPFDLSVFLQPDVYGSLITRFSSDQEAAAYVARLVDGGFQFLDFTGTGTDGIRYAYSGNGLINAARVHQTGWDVTFNYSFGKGPNNFNVMLSAATIDKIDTGFCGECAAVDLADTYGQPLKTRLRGQFTWARGSWTWNAAANYANSYSDTTQVPAGRIDSLTTIDLNARYEPTFWPGATIGLNVINVFDEDPPRTASGLAFVGMHYDIANADPLGRVVSIQLKKSW